ncbi:hypothetical protein NSK_004808 [Nannochloropsis salina CCMP1776]|uniref:Elongation factor P C-terminal domain-containing protein n=1 Tax=Nannochloropsis salina CCMP1776 TaxID=1027361 RepID=A0A4D9CYV6_9STRA|nr:hypothetical protein NSK_004808 [Nannochloropsis salina CCMP1776]|eukprot:TFJ83704.1 hypothetical protein NSK_004808 [Nannochloropsis salina CCMP1776]
MVKRAQAVKPGKGGAFNQVELRDIRTGLKYHERLRASEDVEKVRLDDEELYDYLYEEGDKLVLMNKQDFTQIEVSRNVLSETEQKFLQEGLTLRVQFHEGSPLLVRLPRTLVVEVASTEPFSKGSQASPTFKPATLSNGEVLKVPPFVGVGEKVIINTEEMEYQSRV